MKLTKLLSLLLALMMVFALVGCGDSDKDDDDDDKKESKPSTSQSSGGNKNEEPGKEDLSDEELIIGKWAADLDLDELAELFEEDADDLEEAGIDGMSFAIEFTEDGTAYSETVMGEEIDEDETEYEFKDGALYVDGEEQEYKFKDEETLVLTLDGIKIEFERKSSGSSDKKPTQSAKPSKDDDAELIIGKWVAEFTQDELAELFEMDVEDLEEEGIDGMTFVLEFEDDGTVTMEQTMGEESESEEMEYEFVDGELTIEGDEQPYEFDGDDTLILEMDGMEVEFERD